MTQREDTMEAGAEFPCMGEHVAEGGREAMVWAGAGDDELAAQIERDEWRKLPSDKWGKTLPNPANEALFDRMGQIVDNALSVADLCARRSDWIMTPRCLLDGPVTDPRGGRTLSAPCS